MSLEGLQKQVAVSRMIRILNELLQSFSHDSPREFETFFKDLCSQRNLFELIILPLQQLRNVAISTETVCHNLQLSIS